jgi:hypothetical protein
MLKNDAHTYFPLDVSAFLVSHSLERARTPNERHPSKKDLG